jgi:glutamyl-tRNA synthetase
VTTAPRVRIAPSPTGYFHVGTGRTALFNWLFARQQGGSFLLRVEDTDASRNRPEYTEGILRAMDWLGLDWDEPPYFQSEHAAEHTEAIAKLLAGGQAYACDCTREQIDARNEANGRPLSAGYDGYCRDRGLPTDSGSLIRFRVPEGETSFEDLIRGSQTVQNSTIEDFGIRKSDGGPLFYLANTVDDAIMEITHVARGEEHLPNTSKYVLLWSALGFGAPPVFAHLPLILNEQKPIPALRDRKE